jgi:hypothetical protein
MVLKRFAALLSLLVLPFAEASETAPLGFDTAVQQLRSAVGLWDVETTQFADDGAVARVACGTYRFDWVVPDRVLAGRSDIPDWKQSAGILFYVNERRSTIEMASVGTDGQLQVMRVTRFNVSPDRLEARMEVSTDGGANWKPGHHQVFRRAVPDSTSSAGGLKYRRRQQPYVPLT